MKRILLTCLTLLSAIVLYGQVVVTGKITDNETGEAIPETAVIVDDLYGTLTKTDGRYFLTGINTGKHTIEVKMLGYRFWKDVFYITKSDTLIIDVKLLKNVVETDEIVVSATKTENYINEVPARVNLVTDRMLKGIPALSVDDYLANIPGINISRSFGILSNKATVTMRGLSGNEQSRVLVMIDGIPLNKSDGGSVNWNLLDPDMVERIEVVKGPVSSVYGSNAMAGAINIITRKPANGFTGSIKAGYGTYNTINGRINLARTTPLKKDHSFYWILNGFYRKSDGYITQSESDQAANSFIVPSNLKEYSGELKLGYSKDKNQYYELDVIYYNDDRGTGEKVYQPEGNTTEHDTYQARFRYNRSSGKFDSEINIFWLNEDYKKVNEYMKDDYTFYKVLSKRIDIGFLSSLSYRAGSLQKISMGVDLKRGSVDAEDVYYTSTDIVYNKGKIFNAGLFIQDEISMMDEKLKVIAGLRYDLATFYKGAFTIETPSGETAFMSDLQNPSFEDVLWHSITPKISVNYSLSKSSRIYVSFGRGFRPSVLDDLCRSGRIKGGFKLANPETDPEYITNIEAGTDVIFARKLRASVSAYYSIGSDFMYYVNSGDSIDMGYGDRPIYKRTNIPKVHIYGIEIEMNYKPSNNLTFNAAYSVNYSEIISYKKPGSNDPVDLTGKHLTDVPCSTLSLSGRWMNSFADLSMVWRYQDAMWVNDQNIYDEIVDSDMYPAYSAIDMKVTKEIKMIKLDLGIQNILDKKFYDVKGAVCPGRFITFDVKVSF